MILGWATGGIIFGMMSDQLGPRENDGRHAPRLFGFHRALGLLRHSWVDFTIYRFLVGLGVGGMFGAATTLVAESVPAAFRAMALGSLQALSALGNIIGSLISLQIPPGADGPFVGGYSGWRVLFFVGILPALLVVPIIFILKEPESWLAREGSREGRRRSQARRIAARAVSRLRAGGGTRIVGLFLGVSGMIGLWGIGFFSPELISTALAGAPQADVDRVRGLGTALQDVGAFLGHGHVHGWSPSFLSRRLAFLGALLLSMVVTMFVFNSLQTASDAYWMLPMMGFAQLARVCRLFDLLSRALSRRGCAAPAWASATTPSGILPRRRRFCSATSPR